MIANVNFAKIGRMKVGSIKTLALAALLGLFSPNVNARPEVLPAGPNIEPYPDKPPPSFLVPKGVTNLAAGKEVTSSVKPFTNELSRITDGKKEAFDYDCVIFKRGAQWVQIDLGESKQIFAIAMWHDHRYTQTMHDVIVRVSNDPEFKEGVTTLFNNDRDDSSKLGRGTDLEYFETHYGRIVDGKGTKARYVRGYTNGSNLWAGNVWQEIEVYGFSTDPTGNGTHQATTNAGVQTSEPLKLQLPAPALK